LLGVCTVNSTIGVQSHQLEPRTEAPDPAEDNFWSSNTWLVDSPATVWTFSGVGLIKHTNILNTTTDVICVGVEETQE
jgi:hypothetical protein